MKRYRLCQVSFDSRSNLLQQEIYEDWDEPIKQQWQKNKALLVEDLQNQYGIGAWDQKAENLKAVGPVPISVLAFHNQFFSQVHTSFVVGSYYPALVAACTLGERILNHLMRILRQDFKATREYKDVYDKESFDKWEKVIEPLHQWGVLLPDTTDAFNDLKTARNRAIHFRPETDQDARTLALNAIQILGKIIRTQFGAFGPQPWFIPEIPGAAFIKKEAETQPFVKHIYLPNCLHMSPTDKLKTTQTNAGMVFSIDENGSSQPADVAGSIEEITDSEFARLVQSAKNAQ